MTGQDLLNNIHWQIDRTTKTYEIIDGIYRRKGQVDIADEDYIDNIFRCLTATDVLSITIWKANYLFKLNLPTDVAVGVAFGSKYRGRYNKKLLQRNCTRILFCRIVLRESFELHQDLTKMKLVKNNNLKFTFCWNAAATPYKNL